MLGHEEQRCRWRYARWTWAESFGPQSTRLRGLRSAVTSEAAFRQELILGVLLTPAAIRLGENGVERALMIGVLLIVLIVELLNSAIEAAVDRVGEEPHDLSRRAKDLGSAAVFVSLIAVPVVWGLVLARLRLGRSGAGNRKLRVLYGGDKRP